VGMTHYSDNPGMVRVDYWKPSGKWYMTEAVQWTGRYNGKDALIHEAFADSLAAHFKGRVLDDFRATCLEPYHEHAHPISLDLRRVPEIIRERDEREARKARQ